MSANKSKGTKLKLLFGKLLCNAGIRYRKNDKSVTSNPDFVIKNAMIAIFYNGEFWHGRNWDFRKYDHSNCDLKANIMKKQIIHIGNAEINLLPLGQDDYISLTDMAHSQMQEHIIFRWMSLKSTIEYIGEWEALYNPNFNYTEFGTIKNAAGSNNFVLSVKTWIERTNAIGIVAKAGRYGGTYAHKDIAYNFGMWISPRFQLLLVKEYQRLQEEKHKLLGWTAKRELSKINYHIHTDAIKQNLIPNRLTPQQISYVYANEADVLNVALFGQTAKQWREDNPDLKGNIRDYASINELICLANMENLNAVLINEGISQSDRLVKLNQIAIQQMKVLEEVNNRKLLK